jgi:RHS repeat-associated protein
VFPGVKHLDPIIGLDVHIVQPPGPVPPVPIPHPYIGMMLDPIDYIPIIGATVYINGLPRVTAGTQGLPVPPHLPIGGMFVKPPTSESEMMMGSATVIADENPLGYAPLPVLSCQDIGIPGVPRPRKKGIAKSLLLPTTQIIPIPAGPPVLVGGPPSILAFAGQVLAGKIMGRALKGLGKLAKKSKRLGKAAKGWKRVSNYAHKKARQGMDKIGLNKLGFVGDYLRNRVHRGICSLTGHPVDVATGKVLTEQVDFELPGPIPLRWERVWFSTSRYRGPLGHGWHHIYDSALLVVGDQAIAVRTGDGREQAFLPIAVGGEQFDRKEKVTLIRDGEGYGLRFQDGIVHRFGEVVAGEPQRLVRIDDVHGNSIRFEYDRHARLCKIVDSCGRDLVVTSDSDRRIVQISGPHPTDPARRQVLVDYSYDGRGNLAQVLDTLGQAMRFEHRTHLLAKETNRNGLSFHFQYDGEDEKARCVRTWGDGGIYDHKLTYEQGYTVVENSLGFKTTYFHSRGVVVRTTDALGAVRQTERNGFNELIRETDPLGHAIEYQRDHRGNIVRVTEPDGSVLEVEYDAQDRVVAAEDVIGGKWAWRYDEDGRLVERSDPLRRRTEFHYAGKRLSAVTDPAGQHTLVTYTQPGMIAAVRTPNGAENRWEYDLLGRCVAATDPRGNVQRRFHDGVGRVIRVEEPDGNARELKYDPEGHVTYAKDVHTEIRMAYSGLGRLVTRTESGTTIAFEYDREERLVGIQNENGHLYRFALGPTGEIDHEIGFDETRRSYQRDLAGRVTEVRHPSGRATAYRYDQGGRVIAAKHSDGSEEAFAYRPDGEMIRATNGTATVELERDLLGRVVKETTGGDWIAHDHDILGFRRTLSSSRGFSQSTVRNELGDVLAVKAAAGSASFEARFTRDHLGLELERSLPGGIRSRWERDRLGRPLKQEVWSGATFKGAKQYTWDSDDRLRTVIDALKGPTQYRHDPLGNLVAAVYEDARMELRLPDALGNLFRAEDRTDRKYGPSGQLLEAVGPTGTTRYDYDGDGNLIRKVAGDGGTWQYEWDSGRRLSRVVRPDAGEVLFGYDPLGRRLWKRFRGKTTRWIWDSNVPLHEWTEEDAGAGNPSGTRDAPVTWIFEPDTFAPLGKLRADDAFSVVTDHVGAPIAMFDREGQERWTAEYDLYGALRSTKGDTSACPFRWPGQYEDPETGLHYSRFRYYDPEAGVFISKDPIELDAGFNFFAYTPDPLTTVDPLGLMPWPEPTRMGHHLVPRGKANSVGLTELGTKVDTPTFFPRPYDPGMHEALHAAQSPHIGKLQGPWEGTPESLIEASGKGLKDVPHIRGDLKIPRTGEVLATNVTPAQAFRKLKAWQRAQRKRGESCS